MRPWLGHVWLIRLVGCVILFAACGCGSADHNLVSVEGRVTIDGEPVTEGTVQFWPSSGRPASGQLGENGRFTHTTYIKNDGVATGKYAVTVTAKDVQPDEQKFQSLRDELDYGTAVAEGKLKSAPSASAPQGPTIVWIVPERYSRRTSSDLVAEVSSDSREINFELTSEE